MQKIFFLVILVWFSLLAKSQDSTDYTLNNIKQYATGIDQSLQAISSQTTADKQTAVAQQAEKIKVNLDSIEAEMEYLPDEYYYRLSSLVSSYRTDIDEFEKLVWNKDFQNKDKYITRAFVLLQQRQTSLGKVLHTAYETALQQQTGRGNKPFREEEDDAMQDIEQQSAASTTISENSSEVVLVESVDPNEITTPGNTILLNTIYQAQQQIESWINGIRLQMKENNSSKIGIYANNISNASLKIRDLALLLKTNQKESLFILATGLTNLSDTLRKLTLQGMAAQDEMQDCIDKIAIKYSSLSTGISLVQ